MAKVNISFIKNHLWLRSGNSELLITPEHIVALHKRHDKKDFANYFLRQALLNRPARKLFQSWARKDTELWRKIYTLIISLKIEPSEPDKASTEVTAKEIIEANAEMNTEDIIDANTEMGAENIIDANAEISAETNDKASTEAGEASPTDAEVENKESQ